MDSEMLMLQEVRGSELTEVGRIMRNSTVELGRNPSVNGIPIANQTVSSSHGKIFSFANLWIYADLGSTNGSWVNGEAAPSGAYRFLRNGDTLQLADTILRVTELLANGRPVITLSQTHPKRSLLVMVDDQFTKEFAVPEYGRSLMVGGIGADLEIQGAMGMSNNPAMIIERKGMFTTMSVHNKAVPVSLGGVLVEQPTNIRDADLIEVSGYKVLFNDPPIPSVSNVAATVGIAQWENSSPASAGALEATRSLLDKPAQSSVFGRPLEFSVEEIDTGETQRMNPSSIPKRHGRDYHPSMRSTDVPETGFSFESFEEKAVWIIGFALFLAFLVLLAIWLFARHPAAA